MNEPRLLPSWAEDLRRRYLRGEASMFVLHGNVYDVVVHGQKTSSLVDFLTDVLLKDTRESIAVYNMATGPRFAKRAAGAGTLDDVLGETHKDKVLPALERLLVGIDAAAVILEYAESLAPAGDPTFQADADRSAIITLHRWSSLPAIEKSDNIILLIAENLTRPGPEDRLQPEGGRRRHPHARPGDPQGRGAHRGPATARDGRGAVRRGDGGAEGGADRIHPDAAARLGGRSRPARSVHRRHPRPRPRRAGPRQEAGRPHGGDGARRHPPAASRRAPRRPRPTRRLSPTARARTSTGSSPDASATSSSASASASSSSSNPSTASTSSAAWRK